MRISDWSSDVCSSDLGDIPPDELGIGIDGQAVRVSDFRGRVLITTFWASWCGPCVRELELLERLQRVAGRDRVVVVGVNWNDSAARYQLIRQRSEEHTSELQSLMRISYAVFCLKKKIRVH